MCSVLWFNSILSMRVRRGMGGLQLYHKGKFYILFHTIYCFTTSMLRHPDALIVLTTCWWRDPGRGPRGGRYALHSHRGRPRLPLHGEAKTEVGGQVQARLSRIDLTSPTIGQHYQASTRREAHLEAIMSTSIELVCDTRSPPGNFCLFLRLVWRCMTLV